MQIANIVLNKGRKLLNVEEFISVMTELPEEIKFPTLIIGWDLVKKLFPDQSILKKEIKDNLYWTFTKNERRVEYDKDIIRFYKLIFNNIMTNELKYYYFDIFKVSFNKMKTFINLIKSDKNKFIYVHNNSFIYLFYDNFVIGISIEDLEYMDICSKKVFRLLYSNKNNIVFYDTSFISKEVKNIIMDNKIIIPYLYSLIIK